MTIREIIDQRISELSVTRWWVARHENMPCHPETFMRFMRHETDTVSAVIDAAFLILGISVTSQAPEPPTTSPFLDFPAYRDLVDACYYRRWRGFRVPKSCNDQIEKARLAKTPVKQCAKDLPDPNHDLIKTKYPFSDYEITTGEEVYGY